MGYVVMWEGQENVGGPCGWVEREKVDDKGTGEIVGVRRTWEYQARGYMMGRRGGGW